MKYKGILRENKAVYKTLLKRKKELKLSLTGICNDAHIRGMDINVPSLSKYFTRSDDNNVTEEAIAWLCCRYGVNIELVVGEACVEYIGSIPEYNEKECLIELRKRFPKNR